MAFNGKQFVAVGWSGSIVDGFCGKIFTSRTGIQWKRRESCSVGVLNAVACSPDAFVAVGEGNAVWRSTDGKQWERVDHLPTEANWNAITFSGSEFIAVGDEGALMTSEDGLLWTAEATGWSDLWGVASNGQVSVAVTSYGTILACGLSSP
ncbi:MAG: hypothetical protein B7Z74_06365 [Deltaproteobacteria bacterium 21-66-5]|nr:MAG: hypothetical protein B7Z74_06365 [Deltaproteobacteria bacterium 21-66-5]